MFTWKSTLSRLMFHAPLNHLNYMQLSLACPIQTKVYSILCDWNCDIILAHLRWRHSLHMEMCFVAILENGEWPFIGRVFGISAGGDLKTTRVAQCILWWACCRLAQEGPAKDLNRLCWSSGCCGSNVSLWVWRRGVGRLWGDFQLRYFLLRSSWW